MIYEKTINEVLNEEQERREIIKRSRFTRGIDLNKAINEAFNETINKAIEEIKQTINKASEICVSKGVSIRYLAKCKDYKKYYDHFKNQGKRNRPSFELLTQEEFDIVKKALLWMNWK